MIGRIEEIEKLIVESRELDRRAAEVQGERELNVEPAEIDQLSDDYNRWYARAMAVLPEDQHTEFKDLYDGGYVVKRIKTFLGTPGEVNKMFDPEAETNILGASGNTLTRPRSTLRCWSNARLSRSRARRSRSQRSRPTSSWWSGSAAGCHA
jgi:hypothetical protein